MIDTNAELLNELNRIELGIGEELTQATLLRLLHVVKRMIPPPQEVPATTSSVHWFKNKATGEVFKVDDWPWGGNDFFEECTSDGEPITGPAITGPLRLEVGKRYRARDGQIAYVDEYRAGDTYPYHGYMEDSPRSVRSWLSTGGYYRWRSHDWDLISEVV